MGELIRLDDRRAARGARSEAPWHGAVAVVFHFDLACPFSYLAIERVERLLPSARWQPTLAATLTHGGPEGSQVARTRDEAQRRARELRLPLVWPARHSGEVRGAMRAARFATDHGRGAAFALAAARLAFCGGFDLDDPDVLAEAAAASGLAVADCLAAGGDTRIDGVLEAEGRRLAAAGASRLPVVRVGGALHCGERHLVDAAATLRLAVGARAGAR